MMATVLIQAACWGVDVPPLGLAILSSYLRNKQHKVSVLDLNVELYNKVKPKWKRYWSPAEYEFWNNYSLVESFVQENDKLIRFWLKKILAYDPQIVGFSVQNSSAMMSLFLARKIKEQNQNLVIVFGGPQCARYRSATHFIKQDFVDIVVCGEGENTLAEIVSQVERNGKISFIPGTLLKRNSEIVDCGERPLIEELNSLPFADFSDFSLDIYACYSCLPISSGRGCIRRCTFCDEWLFWKKYRYRKGEVIFEEIKYQLEKHPRILVFGFYDSLLNGNLEEMSKLCDLIIKNKLRIFWSGQAIIRPEMTLELLRKFKKAGCYNLNYGIESGSDIILCKMKKGFTIKMAEKVIRNTWRAGINVGACFMFGFPGETKKDFQQTLEFVQRNEKYIKMAFPSFSICRIDPGSYLHEHPEKYGIIPHPGGVFWETEDGENTFPLRLERFEKFCKFLYSLGIGSFYPYTHLVNRCQLLGDYYFEKNEYKKALRCYAKSIKPKQPCNETLLERIKFCCREIKNA